MSEREKRRPQLFTLESSGGEAARLTVLPEGILAGFAWSPGGKHIAFRFRETHVDWTEAVEKDRKEKGGSIPPRITEDLWCRYDGDGCFQGRRHHDR